jgi:hypothetical protein
MRVVALRFQIALLVFIVAGCGTTVQTTSGRDYLAAYPTSAVYGTLDERVREVANVEPLLRFPGRLGLARIGLVNGRIGLTPVPSEEAKAWTDLADDLGPEYGNLVPISPLVAAMFAPVHSAADRLDAVRETLETVRLAAARQHLDAVLVYEVDATADSKNNPLSIADWTVIGAFVLPSQDVKAEGIAQGSLIDVRNGYHYGTIQASADDQGTSARFANQEAQRDLSKRVQTAAVQNLAHETRTLLRQLKVKLADLSPRFTTN